MLVIKQISKQNHSRIFHSLGLYFEVYLALVQDNPGCHERLFPQQNFSARVKGSIPRSNGDDPWPKSSEQLSPAALAGPTKTGAVFNFGAELRLAAPPLAANSLRKCSESLFVFARHWARHLNPHMHISATKR